MEVRFGTHVMIDGQWRHMHHRIARTGDAVHRDASIEDFGKNIVKGIVPNPRRCKIVGKSNAISSQLQHVHGQGGHSSAKGMSSDEDRSLRRTWDAAIVNEHALDFAFNPGPHAPKSVKDLTTLAVLMG